MKNINENVINKMKKIVKDKQAMKIDGVLVDLYTASAVTQIYDKVNPANKKKMEKMSPQSLQTAAFKILGKKESVSEDASGMNPKQKMKFDQLMKKLDGGKEHLKFKRMAKNSVQGDDMFHGYVKDLAMKESVKISFHSKGAKTKWMKKQGVASKEIINQTPTSIELPSRWKDLSKKKDHDEIFSVSISESVQINEVQQKEVDELKKLSKDMQAVLKGFEKIAGMGDKELKNSKYKKDYSAVLKSRDTILFLLDKVQFKLAQQGLKNYLNKESLEENVKIMENDEYDNEGGMALSQLRTAKSAVEDLMSSIKEMDNLPEWVQSKLTKAVDYMDSVRDYMASEEGEEPVNEINDARNAELKRQAKAKVKKSKLDLVSKQKKQAIDRLKSQKRTAKMGGDIAKDSEEMKRLNKTYADKVQKIMQEENVDEASAYADARRAFKRDDKRGLASLKRDTDDSATDSDKKAANKNIIMQIRRAADLPNGAEVEFKNGKGKVDRRTAQQVLVKFNSLKKSFEKDKFQKSIRSLSDVKKMIGR